VDFDALAQLILIFGFDQQLETMWLIGAQGIDKPQ
jgi:hypothetical protein